MTEQKVGSFLAELAQAQHALEILPQVQRELDMERQISDNMRSVVQDREQAIQRYKTEIETHLSTIRALEVSRDDAELRFLEADDNAHKAANLARDMQALVGRVTALLEPTAVPEQASSPGLSMDNAGNEPGAEPWQQGESVVDPTTTTVPTQSVGSGAPYERDTISAQGQNERPPTVSGHADAISPLSASSSSGAATAISGPYSGKLYMHTPGFISRSDWLDGGGSVEGYDWRAGRPWPDGFMNEV